MQGQTFVPDDFPARVRAARAYAGDMSQADLARELGMSTGYVKGIEKGKGLKDLEARSLLERLPEVTGLPRSFFLGEQIEEDSAKLDAILTQLNELTTTTRDRYAKLESRLGKVDPDVADEAIRVLAEARMRLGRDIGRRSLSAARATDRRVGR